MDGSASSISEDRTVDRIEMSENGRSIDEGTAYSLPEPSYEAALTEVAKGTPMGELLRRYWQPFELSKNVESTPVKIRLLGEDLIAFRNEEGRVGLVHHRCMHRGTSLFYGKIDGEGIRCCYHGWKFGIEGHCLDQPGEPKGGVAKHRYRQPWYPVEEKYGLLWAYMGPPDKKPLMPIIEIFEGLEDGEALHVNDNNIGMSARFDNNDPIEFNWLQHFENLPDLAHFGYLHVMHSGTQFEGGGLNKIFEDPNFRLDEFVTKSISWEYSEAGHASHMIVQMGEGGPTMRFTLEAAMPTWRCVPNPWGMMGVLDHIGFVVPVDDKSFKILTVLRGKVPLMYDNVKKMADDKWDAIEKDPSFHQTNPDDWEAQYGQGPITYHSEEHLVTTDKGVGQLRRLYRQQIERIERGEDPIGVGFTPEEATVKLVAGLYLEKPAEGAGG